MILSRKLFPKNFDYTFEGNNSSYRKSIMKYGYLIHGLRGKVESIDTRISNTTDISTREVSYTELPSIEMFDTQMWRGLIHETTDYRHTGEEMFDTRKIGRLGRIDTHRTA